MNRPEGCRFWTADDISNWIKEHVSQVELQNQGHDSPEHAALWWLSYEAAASMVEFYRIKDWATMLQEGIPAMEPSDLDNACQAPHYDNADKDEVDFAKEADAEMEDHLKKFWLERRR